LNCTSFIDNDQGDLLLLVFLLAVVLGGFTAGYNLKALISEKTSGQRDEPGIDMTSENSFS
jgi:hypothetical protein